MKKIVLILAVMMLIPISSASGGVDITVQRITAWKLEKIATTCTGDFSTMVIQGPSKELMLLEINPQQLRVTKLSILYQEGNVAGPEQAPGTLKAVSEPQLPQKGDFVSFIGTSAGRQYLVSLHISGKGGKYAVVPETTIDGIKLRWDLLWFRLSGDGSRYFGVVKGTVTTPGKKGTCLALVTQKTDGYEIYFIHRPRWNGKAFYYAKDAAGKILSPIGISRNTSRVFFKAEVGQSKKHAIYSCNFNGSNYRLVTQAQSSYTISATTSKVFCQDIVSDDGKFIVLNDNGIGHAGAVTIDAVVGDIKAKLGHKSVGISCGGLYSFFADETGFGLEFLVGGEPFTLIQPNSLNFPVIGKVNNRGNQLEPPISTVTCSPLGFVGRSETDLIATGEVYFVGINNPPIPPKPDLKITTPVIDFGIVEGNTTAILGIGNESKTAISGKARIIKSETCTPFSFSGNEEVEFSTIGDIPLGLNSSCMAKGFTYETQIAVSSPWGNTRVPVVATLNDDSRLLAKLGLNRITAWIGTSQVKLNSKPYSDGGTTMVPLRFLVDLLPCDFAWDKDTQTAKIVFQNLSAQITVGSDNYFINDSELKMPKPAVIKEGQTFIPLRVTEAFGATISWFAPSQSILLNFPKPNWGRESISIEGIPSGAIVTINYVRQGKAPLTVNHLLPGKYEVKVTEDGFENYTTIIDLPPSPGKVLYFLQRIVPTKGTVKVESNPKGANIFVDNKPITSTPSTLQLDPGLHIVRVALFGFPDHISQVVVLAGQEFQLKADLESLKPLKEKMVTPNTFKATIKNGRNMTSFFDLTVTNNLTIPSNFVISCPDREPIGFDSIGLITLDGLTRKITTQKILPGDSMKFRIQIDASEMATSLDVFKDVIRVEPENIISWRVEVPFEVVIDGEKPSPPKLLFNVEGEIKNGRIFTVKFKIENAFDLAACSFKLSYQPERIKLLNIEDGKIFGDNVTFGWDDDDGEITVTGPTKIGSGQGFDGDGVLIVFTFQAKKEGETVFDCSWSRLFNTKAQEIEHFRNDSTLITIESADTIP